MLPLLFLVIPCLVISSLNRLYKKIFITPVNVQGKVVLVTGASSGLGEGIFIIGVLSVKFTIINIV